MVDPRVTARVKGFIDTMAFRITFTGQTAALRNFVVRLAEFELPILVREVEVEPGFGSEVYATLIARGYKPVSRVADIQFGGVHAILVRPDGRRIGAADPRRDGVAIAQ